MANKIISMNKLRQVLRLYTQGYSKSKIAQQSELSRNTVKKYINKFTKLQLTQDYIKNMTDHQLEQLFGYKPPPDPSEQYKELLAYFPQMEKNLKKKGNTIRKEYMEYREKYPDGYGLTQFGIHYSKWSKRCKPVMHIDHKAGDKMYIDYAGEKLPIVDKETGEIKDAEVFVGILGASQLTYVEATESQKGEDLITACENTIHYFKGVPMAIVPDNLKSAVSKSDKYEPTLNERFADFAEHYGTTILPTRAYRPRDKALVEGAVKIVYNRIYTALRGKTFYSLEELNKAILILLEEHNNALLTGRDYSRRQLFEEIEREALQPLPATRYEFKKQAYVTVMKIGYVCLREDHHYYSVPYWHIGKKVKIIYSKTRVYIYYKYECIASHHRDRRMYQYTTIKEHLAPTHQFMTEWNPERFIKWADSIGEPVKILIGKVLEKRVHPEQAYKSCMGILHLEKKVGGERLINACRRALEFGMHNYRAIVTILEKNLDQYPKEENDQDGTLPFHNNIRGNKYYQ